MLEQNLWFVPGDYPTVELAMNAAKDGDWIIIGADIIQQISASVFQKQKKNIYLFSEKALASSILRGQISKQI